MSACPWKIHWGVSLEHTTQCDRNEHLPQDRLGLVMIEYRQGEHEGPSGIMPGQCITWQAGDRREFTGDWPGYCTKLPGVAHVSGGCTLHEGHHGRCAP